ncbi:hypothetical protein WG66_006009 [Moniliophthora roreri]|nr:hypothetical protein WG66_006009 [Moniliophthora roreri]
MPAHRIERRRFQDIGATIYQTSSTAFLGGLTIIRQLSMRSRWQRGALEKTPSRNTHRICARKQIKALFQFPRQAPMRPIIAMVKYLSQCVHSSLPAGTATTGSVNGAGPLMVRGRSSSSRNRWSVPHCIDAPASDISIPSNHNVICSLAFATFRPSNIRT